MPKTQTSNCRRFNAVELPDKEDRSNKSQVSLQINTVDSGNHSQTSLSANHRISRAEKTFMECSATKWTLLNQVTGKSEAKLEMKARNMNLIETDIY
jgi:hypothetical protein